MSDKSQRVPFLCQYAEPLQGAPTQTLRYDQIRQVSQVLVGEDWIDTPDARVEPAQTSRITRVRPETSDEE